MWRSDEAEDSGADGVGLFGARGDVVVDIASGLIDHVGQAVGRVGGERFVGVGVEVPAGVDFSVVGSGDDVAVDLAVGPGVVGGDGAAGVVLGCGGVGGRPGQSVDAAVAVGAGLLGC